MEVRCDKCQARYRVDDARIGPAGLTMRGGKCQNTFKVRRPEAAAAPPPAAPPAAPAAPPDGATQILAAPKPAPAKPAAAPPKPSAPPAKPAAAPAKPAPAKPATTPAADEAGRTMMFQTG